MCSYISHYEADLRRSKSDDVPAFLQALRDRHALFERLVHVRSQQLHFVSTTEQQPMPAAQLREPVRPEHVDQPIYHLLCRHALDQNEQLRFSSMSRQEFAGQWKAYMSEASSCLLALGCGMDSTIACATGSRGSAQTATEAVPGPSCMSAAAACRLVELNIAIDYTARNFSLQNPQAFESVSDGVEHMGTACGCATCRNARLPLCAAAAASRNDHQGQSCAKTRQRTTSMYLCGRMHRMTPTTGFSSSASITLICYPHACVSAGADTGPGDLRVPSRPCACRLLAQHPVAYGPHSTAAG